MNKAELLKRVDMAFLPAKEIEVPDLFSGREKEIAQGVFALRSEGASLCIFGERGVGKTSFAKQLRLVASGYSKLTDLIGKSELFDEKLFNMPAIYFPCDDTVKDANDLFRKLLSDRDAINGICKYNDGIILKKTKEKATISAKFTMKILESSADCSTETENVFAELDPVSAFKSVTSEIVDAANAFSMVVVIDEFERVANKIAIASIIRTCPYVKFIIVGVADDVTTLIQDHTSVERQLVEGTIKLNPMTYKMLAGIINRATAILEDIKFEDEVTAHIISISGGYPYWVHLLGRHCSIDAINREQKIINMENYNNALDKIVTYQTQHERIYKDIASSSQQDEIILKIMALHDAEDISIDEIRREASKKNIQTKTVEYFIKKLFTRKIIRRDGSILSFTDTFFKIFARIRLPLFAEAKYVVQLDDYYKNLTSSIRRWQPETYEINSIGILESYQYLNSISSFETSLVALIDEPATNFISPHPTNKKKSRKFDECPCGSGKKINMCCGIYKK